MATGDLDPLSEVVLQPPAPGWFGKLPALGDFASRRLPSGFIETWDAWLQRSITTSQQALGGAWTEIYLKSPIWRFALMPGACGPSGWAGILMPSVDKIGRYFPLTIVAEVAPDGEMPGASAAAQGWYAGLEHVALSALNVNSGVDDMENALEEHRYPFSGESRGDASADVDALARWWLDAASGPQRFEYTELATLGEAFRLSPQAASRLMASGKSLWWSAPPIAEPVQLHGCAGLPPEDYFAMLLQGGRSTAGPPLAAPASAA